MNPRNAANWLKARGKKNWPWVGVVFLAYLLGKVYVAYTPTPVDDALPDQIKDAVLLMVYESEDMTQPETPCVSEEDCVAADESVVT